MVGGRRFFSHYHRRLKQDMKKLLLMVVAILGMSTTQAQDLSFNFPTTDALVTLGTTGNAKPWAMEQGGTFKGKITGATVSTGPFLPALTMKESEMSAGFFGFAPEVAYVDGWIFRMIAPSVHPDNFVAYHEATGVLLRFDLGVDEGTNEVTLISQHQ